MEGHSSRATAGHSRRRASARILGPRPWNGAADSLLLRSVRPPTGGQAGGSGSTRTIAVASDALLAAQRQFLMAADSCHRHYTCSPVAATLQGRAGVGLILLIQQTVSLLQFPTAWRVAHSSGAEYVNRIWPRLDRPTGAIQTCHGHGAPRRTDGTGFLAFGGGNPGPLSVVAGSPKSFAFCASGASSHWTIDEVLAEIRRVWRRGWSTCFNESKLAWSKMQSGRWQSKHFGHARPCFGLSSKDRFRRDLRIESDCFE